MSMDWSDGTLPWIVTNLAALPAWEIGRWLVWERVSRDVHPQEQVRIDAGSLKGTVRV